MCSVCEREHLEQQVWDVRYWCDYCGRRLCRQHIAVLEPPDDGYYPLVLCPECASKVRTAHVRVPFGRQAD